MGAKHSFSFRSSKNAHVEKTPIEPQIALPIADFKWCRLHRMFILQAVPDEQKETICTVYTNCPLRLKKRSAVKRDRARDARKKRPKYRARLCAVFEHCSYV